MKQILLLLNGIKYPYDLVDKAIKWAKKNSLPLHVIFLSGEEHEEQYPFPSDLDAAQDDTDKQDAEYSDLLIMESRIKLLQGTAEVEGVNCTTEIMIQPSIEDVTAKANNAEAIFITAEEVDDVPMAVTSFKMTDLVARLPEAKVIR